MSLISLWILESELGFIASHYDLYHVLIVANCGISSCY